MTLTFADTHNMIAYLTKFDASEGFNQIIDFLNGSSIKLQALFDKKKLIITKATIRDALRLDDAEGRKFNFSKYIFDSLVRNVDSSTKFYMYPRFLQLMISKQVGDLSSHTTKYTSPALTQKVFSDMRRVCKGCSGVETPLFEGMIVEQQVDEGVPEVNVEDIFAVGITEGAASTTDDDVNAAVEEPSISSPPPPTQSPPPSQDIPSTSQDKIAQALEITKLKSRVKKLDRRNKASKLQRLKKVGTSQRIDTFDDIVMDDVSKQERMIADMDADIDVVLEDAKEVAVEKSSDVKESADIQGRTAESQAQIYQIDLEHANKVLSMQDDDDADPVELQEVVEVVTTAKLIIEVVAAASTTLTKEDNAVKRYQALKRKPQTEAQARKNMMIYLRNVAGFKMDYFKGMTYDDICPIFEKKFNSNVAFLMKTKEQIDEEDSRALKRLSESQDDKTAKKQKLDEEVEELKRHLQIVPINEDGVYTKATFLALKPVQTRRQLTTDPEMCMFVFTVSTVEPKNIKEAMDDSAWINAMQEELHQFDRLQVWELVDKPFGKKMDVKTAFLNGPLKEEVYVAQCWVILCINTLYVNTISYGVDAAMDFKENMLSV
nr:integrase, catalytic region, zinc finger, CCHC-type, peptidase aspartic, catalytic [Tanacetum cinerariifolium]